MTHFAQQTEGLDTNTFLTTHNLDDLIPHFEEHRLTIEDLVDSTEDDIKDICKNEFKISTSKRIRLVKALKSISYATVNQKVETPKVIFLGEDERKILDALEKKNKIIFGNVKEVQIAMTELGKSAVECTKEVHNKYNEMVAILDKRRKSLLDTIANLQKKRTEELQSYLTQIKSLTDIAVKARSECQQVAIKSDISSLDRLNKMKQISDKFNQDEKKLNTDSNKFDTSKFKICLNYNQKLFKSNLEKSFNISFDEETFELKEMEKKEVSWCFKENHPCLVVSNNGLTVNDLNGKCGTILFGDFLEAGFLVVDFKVERKHVCAGLCVIGKQFAEWNGWKDKVDWVYIQHSSNTLHGNEWKNVISKTEFTMQENDIVSIMIDMDSYQAEFKNKTKQQHVKFNLPKRPCGIAVYCNKSQFTVMKQIFDKSQY